MLTHIQQPHKSNLAATHAYTVMTLSAVRSFDNHDRPIPLILLGLLVIRITAIPRQACWAVSHLSLYKLWTKLQRVEGEPCCGWYCCAGTALAKLVPCTLGPLLFD